MKELFFRRLNSILACIVCYICGIICLFIDIKYSIILFFIFLFGIYTIVTSEHKFYKKKFNKLDNLKNKLNLRQIKINKAEVLIEILNVESNNLIYPNYIALKNELIYYSKKCNDLINEDIDEKNNYFNIIKEIDCLISKIEDTIKKVDDLIFKINRLYDIVNKSHVHNKNNEEQLFKNKYNKLYSALKILGLNIDATEKEVKQQYRLLAKKYHPDINPNYEEKFKKIVEAYEIIKTGR